MNKRAEITIDYTGLFIPGGIDDASFAAGMRSGEDVLVSFGSDIKSGALPVYNTVHDKNAVGSVRKVLSNFENYETMIVIGIGGSALGAAALESALPETDRELRFLDNIDPDTFSDVISGLDLDKAVINVISKSGGTTETMANFLVIEQLLKKSTENYQDRLVITTDTSECSLKHYAEESGYTLLFMPEEVGGRFSVLTSVGLLPAAFAGLDIEELLEGAKAMADKCMSSSPADNPAFLLAWSCYYLHSVKNRSIQVIMPYADSLMDCSLWFCQLWGESLGKRFDLEGREIFTGQTPVAARGATDQHSQLQLYVEGPQDKMICFLEVEDFENDFVIPRPGECLSDFDYLGGKSLHQLLISEKRATEFALMRAGCPTVTIKFPVLSEYTLGQYLYMAQFQTVIAGSLYNINPYDQPGVESGKKANAATMGKDGMEELKREVADYFNGKRRTV